MRQWITIDPETAEPYIVTKDVDFSRAVAIGAGIGGGVLGAAGGVVGGVVTGLGKILGLFREKKHVNRVIRELLFASLDQSRVLYTKELERAGTDAYFPSLSVAVNPTDADSMVKATIQGAMEAVSGDDRDDFRRAIATLKTVSTAPSDRRGILISFDAIESYATVPNRQNGAPAGLNGLWDIPGGGVLLPIVGGIVLLILVSR